MLGTIAAVYGWFVHPIGWGYALLVWGYALVWLFIDNVAKIWVYRAMRSGAARYRRHLDRVHRSLHDERTIAVGQGRVRAAGPRHDNRPGG